ncbi:hypothetical protein CY34DRAFT_569787 [Suillus luteus UH-Slu-Lm8-n1]|uniref:Uncharacterized protein n=1 Tax=Suillus luteus UH-Slu-Lm8-n1 TaxID=930992 RepID=A0A0D0AMV3_9AGAM|nr:hypothetical protein CY34DRAFT_569787 [Suillus luteus UH-Slu-Lm8-n1]
MGWFEYVHKNSAQYVQRDDNERGETQARDVGSPWGFILVETKAIQMHLNQLLYGGSFGKATVVHRLSSLWTKESRPHPQSKSPQRFGHKVGHR